MPDLKINGFLESINTQDDGTTIVTLKNALFMGSMLSNTKVEISIKSD